VALQRAGVIGVVDDVPLSGVGQVAQDLVDGECVADAPALVPRPDATCGAPIRVLRSDPLGETLSFLLSRVGAQSGKFPPDEHRLSGDHLYLCVEPPHVNETHEVRHPVLLVAVVSALRVVEQPE
jgi:hypothetical protein